MCVSPDACQQEFLQEISSQPFPHYLYDKLGKMLLIKGNRSGRFSNASPCPPTLREEGFSISTLLNHFRAHHRRSSALQ